MTDEKRDFLTNRTLTERVQRLEQYFIDNLDMQDEGDLIPGRGTTAEFNKNHSSREHNYREVAQHFRKQPSGKVCFDVLGGQSGAGDQAIEPAVFDVIMKRILSATDNAAEIAVRIENHGNRLFGPLPTIGGEEGNEDQREPQGSIDHLYLALANLDETHNRLSRAYSRISGV